MKLHWKDKLEDIKGQPLVSRSSGGKIGSSPNKLFQDMFFIFRSILLSGKKGLTIYKNVLKPSSKYIFGLTYFNSTCFQVSEHLGFQNWLVMVATLVNNGLVI